jgi:hypothetical protein
MRSSGTRAVLVTLAALAAVAASGSAAGAASRPSVAPPKLTWSKPAEVSTSIAQALSCATTTFCVSIDNDSNAYSFNGTSWGKPVSLQDPDSDYWAVSCPTSAFCAAVSQSGYGSFYRDGTWSAAQKVETYGMSAVSCASSAFCVAASTSTGDVDIYNGTSWGTPVLIDPAGGAAMYDVSCPSATFCAVIDGAGNVMLLNGTTWSAPKSVESDGIPNSVSCTTAKFCAVTDNDGHLIAYAGGAWHKPVTIDGADYLTVSCAGTNSCVSVDPQGNIIQTQGRVKEYRAHINHFDYAFAASCPATSFCMAMNDGSNEVIGRSAS